MREYGVEKCVCGNVTCIVDRGRALGWFMPTNDGRWDPGVGPFFCWKCGTRVGIDERGPWREAMVPRAALEWLAGISEGCAQVSPCPANKPLSDANKEALCRECLVQAALKAAEEASDGD